MSASLEMKLEEAAERLEFALILFEVRGDVITDRDETIARLTAELDQVEAANQSLHSTNARLIRENTTLRAERREGLS